MPPVLTRTWFHTGAAFGRNHVSDYFAGLRDGQDRGEYYREPAFLDDDTEARRHLLDDTVLPDGLTADEEREACRALKGAMLRQETYALDGPGTADYQYGHPYLVSERNYRRGDAATARRRARRGLLHASEGGDPVPVRPRPHDPRVKHTITLQVDPESGNVRKELVIAYGRRATITTVDALGVATTIPNPGLAALDPRDRVTQGRTLIVYADNAFTNGIDDPGQYPDDFRTPMRCETRLWELTGIAPGNGSRPLQLR